MPFNGISIKHTLYLYFGYTCPLTVFKLHTPLNAFLNYEHLLTVCKFHRPFNSISITHVF